MIRLGTAKFYWAKFCWASVATFVVALAQTPTDAAWFEDLRANFHYDFHRSNCWPQPYIEPDRQHVRDTIEAQVSNGWRRQNLIGEHHFMGEGTELTEAGRIKIRWTLTQVPEHRRTLFVQRGTTSAITEARVAAVEAAAVAVLPEGESPSIQDTHIVPEGRSADFVNYTATQFRQTMPIPQLPAADSDE